MDNREIKRHFLWWEAEDEQELHENVWRVLEHLKEKQATRRNALYHYQRLYTNRNTTQLSPYNNMIPIGSSDRITMNVTKSAIDAAIAKIGTTKTKSHYLTQKGDRKKQKKAQYQTKFVSGLFRKLNQYAQGRLIFRDALIGGTGFQYTSIYKNNVIIKRPNPIEIIVDEDECQDGNPNQMFWVRPVSKYALIKEFPEKAADIENSRDYFEEERYSEFEETDATISLIYGWRLPSFKGAGDGKFFLGTSDCTLKDVSWTRMEFPITWFHWTPPVHGFYGIGAAEEIAPLQMEINYIAQKIQKLMTLATSMVWKEKGSYTGGIDNKDWSEREYTGKPPLFQTTAAVSAEYFSHLDRLFNRAYELVGISLMQATSRKPAGIEAAAAIQTLNDIGNQRFMHVEQCFEDFYINVGEQMVQCARDLVNSGADPKIIAEGDEDIEELLLSEALLEDNSYTVRPWPTNLLPDSPTGKVDTATRLAQIPEIQPYLLRMLTGHPDVDRVVYEVNAPLEMAEESVSLILDDGQYISPDPHMDLNLARIVAVRALLNAMKGTVDEERISLLRQYIEEIDQLQALAEPPPMPMGPPGAAPQPQGAPAPAAGMTPQLPGGLSK